MSREMEPERPNDSDEELLGAYLDGELDSAAFATFEVRLAQEPGLRARLNSLRAADLAIQGVLGAPLEAVPTRFSRMVESGVDVRPVADKEAVIVPLRQRTIASSAWHLPLAACLALAIGAGGGFMAGDRRSDAFAYVVLGAEVRPELAARLESALSAHTYALAGDAQVRPIASYRAADGRPCREFMLSSSRESAHAVACRDPGGWRLEVAAAAGPKAAGENGYAPVSESVDPAIDAALDRLGVGAGMSAIEESDAIERGWRP